MAMPRKYTPKTLEKAVNDWFLSITREDQVYEMTPDGEMVPAFDRNGEPLMQTRFLVPPIEEKLCDELGISTKTWERYGADPDYEDVVKAAKSKIVGYLKNELLTREGKNTRGVEFALSANYGVAPAAKRELDLGPTAAQVASRMVPLEERGELLKEIAKRFGGDGA